jgi:putative membrane protein
MSNKQAYWWAAILTVVVMGAVIVLNRHVLPVPDQFPSFIFSLPQLIALTNAIVSVLLVASFISIKNKNIELHKKLNLSAMALSVLFLLMYVTAHYFIPDTRFGDVNHDQVMDDTEITNAGVMRKIYFFILSSHILLAGIVFPMVLITFHYGWTKQVDKHKKLARYTFPLWLYVAVTGVVVYFMIKPYYNF